MEGRAAGGAFLEAVAAGVQRVQQLWGAPAPLLASSLILGEDVQQASLWSLPPEVLVHVLSFVANARDLCSVSLACRALAAVSRDDALWKPLGHPSWAGHHVARKGKRSTTLPLQPGVGPYRQHDYTAKVILLGDCGVGKSSIRQRFIRDSFTDHLPNIGAAFAMRVVNWRGFRVKLEVWDTQGAERFRSMPPMYFRMAHGVVLTYDITQPSTLENNVTFWVREIDRHGLEGTHVVLVGNKTDLASTKRAVAEPEARRKAEELGASFCECSAKTGEGVAEAFDLLVESLMSGWQRVAGMATPTHVPSEALLAQLFPQPATSPGASIQQQQQQPQRCALQ